MSKVGQEDVDESVKSYLGGNDFLDEQSNLDGPTILLASYPRSGNTLIRKYLEQMTSVYTGSDCDRKRNLNK